MAATMATTAILNTKCFTINSNKNIKPSTTTKPTSFLPIQTLPKGLGLSITKPSETSIFAGTAIAGAIFSTLSISDPAFAAQQIADLAEGDNRGIALLLPIIPAIAWVLFNILQPALNQVNRMRETKGIMVGLGLTGLAGLGMISVPEASASEIATIAAEAVNDNRGQLLLIVVTPALAWVLFNILQPALNQLNKMRSE
ncbi:photosystem II reaction center proteins PsbY, chloroplastic isoform X2 [Euphorbia lathyris]|uniref:photosystem II reaction center proteins PsbY, chloroplastic isoform X2 n=1 Tax=Euphorbia lathyris TaxID=212925 RepID=UPI0033139D7F